MPEEFARARIGAQRSLAAASAGDPRLAFLNWQVQRRFIAEPPTPAPFLLPGAECNN